MNPIKLKRNPPQKVIHPIPAHNGFGSEEDSLLSVFFLHPETHVRQVTNLFKKDKHILRFTARLVSSDHLDEERKFIISFFCRDDTVQIFEVADKNSGRMSSKFMERKKLKHLYTGKYYSEKDFVIGKSIYVNKYIFKLLECDEYTKKYMKDNPDVFKDSDLSFIINRIRRAQVKIGSQEDFIVEVLKNVDPEGRHWVTSEEICEGLKK